MNLEINCGKSLFESGNNYFNRNFIFYAESIKIITFQFFQLCNNVREVEKAINNFANFKIYSNLSDIYRHENF